MLGLSPLGVFHTAIGLPPAAPLLDSPDAPALKAATALLLVAFLIGATLQVRWMRTTHAGQSA